ncbi:unnamed protein product [Fructobacillus tropaeoli]|uniref:hypothetical protein n=1 Tax=Fructobacillus tropaeoli TaxID=709323 RepID=UPI002D93817C|nr:unnamed protein product [Fructobacillus tropaeoli]
MKQIYRGMDNSSIDVINANFNELSDPNRAITAQNLTVTGYIASKAKVTTVNIGQLKGIITRSGNAVSLSIPPQPWPYSGATAWTVAYDMIVPVGYRPTSSAVMNMINNYKTSLLKVDGTGAIFFTDSDVNGNTNFEAFGNWQTNDDFPA